MRYKITGNEPATGLIAHKVSDVVSSKWVDGAPGLTILQYYAGLAMQGLLSNPDCMKKHKGEKYLMQAEIVAEVSLNVANKMIAELNKQPIPPEQK